MLVPVKFTISAPGKVILFGEHSVVYGKRALAASISKRTKLTFETTASSDAIEVKFCNLNFETLIPLDIFNNSPQVLTNTPASDCKELLNQSEDDVTKLADGKKISNDQKLSLKCVLCLIRGFFAGKKIPNAFKIGVSSQLCMGAGTGSSASFAVCLTAAIYQYSKIINSASNADIENIHQFTLRDKEIINEWAFACEQIIHGKASGIDNFICTYGSIVEMQNCNVGDKRKTEILKDSAKLRMLLINTGVERNTSVLVQKVANCRARNQTVIDLILNAMDELVKSASIILNRMKTQPNMSESFSQLQELISINQGLLCSIGVSHESLDQIVTITQRFNLHSKLTGAGGGGYAITIIPPHYPEEHIQECVENLEKNGYRVEDVVVGDKGVDIEIL